MRTNQIDVHLGNEPGVEVPFLGQLARIFTSNAQVSPLFLHVTEKLAEQARTGEIERLTAHEERICW